MWLRPGLAEQLKRDAEAKEVLRFLRKPHPASPPPKTAVRTVTMKEAVKVAVKAATLLQSTWRGVVDRRSVAASKKMAVAAFNTHTATAAHLQSKKELQSSLAALMSGKRLSAVAIVRGDLKRMQRGRPVRWQSRRGARRPRSSRRRR